MIRSLSSKLIANLIACVRHGGCSDDLVALIECMGTYREIHKKEPRAAIKGDLRDIWTGRVVRKNPPADDAAAMNQDDCMCLYVNPRTPETVSPFRVLINKKAGNLLILIHWLVVFEELSEDAIVSAITASARPSGKRKKSATTQGEALATQKKEQELIQQLREKPWKECWECLVSKHADRAVYEWHASSRSIQFVKKVVEYREILDTTLKIKKSIDEMLLELQSKE